MRMSTTRAQWWRDSGRMRPGVRNRRGAIVVMTGIMIVAIMLIAAISVDASRIFAAKNELQTASDAAALAAAVQLLEDSTGAGDTARAYARRNLVENRPIDSVEVAYGAWRPATRTFIVGGNPVDAVQVTARHALPLSIARVLGDSTVTIESSAIAWSSGPVAESPCAKPLAMPYSELLKTILGYEPPFGGADIELTDEDIQRLREMPEDQRYTHFHYGDSALGTDPSSHYTRAQYFPVDIDSTWNRSDPATNSRPSITPQSFQSYVTGPACSRTVSPGDSVRSEPGEKKAALLDGLSGICESLGGRLAGSPVMRCGKPDGSSIGLPLKVILWAGDAANWENGGRAMLQAKMTGSFVLTEFKWEPDNANDITGQHARMAGHWDLKRDFGPISATSASMLLRPMLVW